MTIKIESLGLLIIAIITIACGQTTKGSETRQCPSYCTCDLYENFNRADCSGQRLVTPNVEVPSAVELLDISYNDITTLDNTCFEGLIYVINLTIAHNALHTVYLDAFGPLKDVKSIDLSYNRLEYFDDRIFETNTKLTRIDLSGNKFMSLQNKPFLRSPTIRYLGLQDAQVTYIYPLMFTEMAALRDVDISNNLMITLSSTAFNTLHQLEALNLEENRWICDKTLEATLQFLKDQGVETKLSSCAMLDLKRARSKASHMFERMMEAPSSEITATESISIDDVWKPKKPIDLELEEELSCELQTPVKVCRQYRNCLANNRILTEQTVDPRGQYQYTLNDLHFVFLTGISLGIAVVTCMVTCWICIKRCWATQKKISQRRADRRVANVPIARRPIPPPVPPRQRRSNRRSGNPPALNRSLSSPARRGSPSDGNHSDFASFVSRFFERPSRHQYYRTINENAGRMIRRLSQSNLLSNRLSQHFIGTRNGDSENVQHTEPLIYPQAVEDRSALRLAQVHLASPGGYRTTPSQSFMRYEETPTHSEITPSVRPETPPPSYVDVMKPKVDV